MNLNAKPILKSCKQYETNLLVFEFIDIADDEETSKLLIQAELDAGDDNTAYIFEFLQTAYCHSYMKLNQDNPLRFQYQLIYLTYKCQENLPMCRNSMPYIIHEKMRQNPNIMAAYSFYYMIFFNIDATINMLVKMGDAISMALVEKFRSGSFYSIVTQMGNLFYMPHIKDEISKEMDILKNIYDLKRNKNTFDLEACVILRMELPINTLIALKIATPAKSPEPVLSKKHFAEGVRLSGGCSSTPISYRAKPPTVVNLKNTLNVSFVTNQEDVETEKENPYIICRAVRTKIADTPRSIKKSRFVTEAVKTEFVEEESLAALDMSFSDSSVLPQFHKYACTSLLGSGTFSRVYGANILSEQNAKCAIKVLLFKNNPTKQSVENEIYLMQLMNKSGVSILLLDSVINDIGAIIVMEMALTDMKHFFESNYDIADKYFIQYYWKSMVNCVFVLHSYKIAHLDLKFQNFVINEKLHVKLIDFGISKELSNDGSVIESEIGGTYVYMSPELLLEKTHIRPYKCDIWSMGIILFMMMYRRFPLEEVKNQEDFVKRMCNNSFLLVMTDNGYGNAILNMLTRDCLRYEAHIRPSARELLRIMNEWDN